MEEGLDLPGVGVAAPDCPEGFLSLLADSDLSDPPDPLLLLADDGDFFPAEVGREGVLVAADAGLEPKLSGITTVISKQQNTNLIANTTKEQKYFVTKAEVKDNTLARRSCCRAWAGC